MQGNKAQRQSYGHLRKEQKSQTKTRLIRLRSGWLFLFFSGYARQ
jgi:hypothetical protein